jgi:hypothetical protein
MDELPPDIIDRLCNLSEEDIEQTDATQLHQLLVVAIEQIEKDLRYLGVDDDLLKTPNRRSALKQRVNQLTALDNRLRFLN